MCEYNGEDLLKLFNELDVDLLNLHPNVIRAWFDTDCKDMKNFLNWMCSSLSRENYVSHLEDAEYLEIESPLINEEYMREIQKLEEKYPDILDVESNINEIKLLEEEIKLLTEESSHLDEIINVYENLDNGLVKDLATATNREVETSLKCKKAQEHCVELSEKLDDINQKLFTQITKYSHNLLEYEYAAVPLFMNNIDIMQSQENLQSVKSLVTPMLEDHLSSSIISSRLSNKTSFESLNDTFIGDITMLKTRILQSHKDLIYSQIESEISKEIVKFLQSNNVDSLLSLKENAYVPPMLQSKEFSQKKMCEVLENNLERLADSCISDIRLKYATQELQDCQTKLNDVTDVCNLLSKLLVQYMIINLFHHVEHKDIDGLSMFFRKIFQYINGDIHKCLQRTNDMHEVIKKYDNYLSSETESFKFIKAISNVLTDKEFNLKDTVDLIFNLENELNLKEQLPLQSFEELKPLIKNARISMQETQLFLSSGPTYRVEMIPLKLSQTLKQIEQLFKKQDASIRSAVMTNENKVKSLTKWRNKKRHLWMYFIVNPSKMFYVLQQLEEACKNKNI